MMLYACEDVSLAKPFARRCERYPISDITVGLPHGPRVGYGSLPVAVLLHPVSGYPKPS
jgi:hypothetical protein